MHRRAGGVSLLALALVLSPRFAHGQTAEPPPDPIQGLRGWITDVNGGIPVLGGSKVNLVGSGTLGYRWTSAEMIGSASYNKFASADGTAHNDNTRVGLWANGAYVTGGADDPYRLVLIGDFSWSNYTISFRDFGPISDPNNTSVPDNLNSEFNIDSSTMIRLSAMLGLLVAPPGPFQARATVGLGFQGQSHYVQKHKDSASLTGETDVSGSDSVDHTSDSSLRQLLRLSMRLRVAPGWVSLRYVGEHSRFSVSHSRIAFGDQYGGDTDLTIDSSFEQQKFTQIESFNRLSLDVERLAFVGLMPSVFGGLDINYLSGPLGNVSLVVPVFGVGLANGNI